MLKTIHYSSSLKIKVITNKKFIKISVFFPFFFFFFISLFPSLSFLSFFLLYSFMSPPPFSLSVMSLTENIPSRRQYSHATGNSESFELFEPTAPNNSNSYRNSPPPPPPARNNAAFSTNNPFRRAPPPPTNNNVSTSPASYHEHHHQKSDSSFLQVSQNIDPSYRSHSANHLESNHTGSSVQNSMPISIPPNNRVSIYNNSQYSNSDQSVFISNPQRGPSLPQQQQVRRDVKSYLSHSSHDSTSSQSSANRYVLFPFF